MKKMTRKNEVILTAVTAKVGEANKELAAITAGGFPFEYGEVRFSTEADEGGIYVYSGLDCICTIEWPKRFDRDAEASVVKAIQHAVNEEVRAIRNSTENRGRTREDAEKLVEEGRDTEAAEKALRDAGVDPAKFLEPDAGREVKDMVFNAAKDAVKEANKGLAFFVLGTRRKYGSERMTIRRLTAGFVISAAGKPVIVTHWPKAGAKPDGMIRHIVADIASCSENRRSYFAHVAEMEREAERIRTEGRIAEKALAAVAEF